MKISRTREVKLPTRGTEFSAGIDFYIPSFSDKFVKDLFVKNEDVVVKDSSTIILEPHYRILIPSGVKVNFEGEPRVLIAFNKSGVSVKKGLDVLACVIDQDYQGEIHLSLVNTSEEDVYICQGEKIAQFIMLPVVYEDIVEVSDKDLWQKKTNRGEGGFGSTDAK